MDADARDAGCKLKATIQGKVGEMGMSFAKAVLALVFMSMFAAQVGVPMDSKAFFIGTCVILAGMVAHSEK